MHSVSITPAIAMPPASFYPLYSGVPAGFPSPATDYMEQPIDLNEHIIQHPASTFFIRVTGESMSKAHILSGSLLVIDRALNAKNNDIVLAVVNGEFTVKRLLLNMKQRVLMPESNNPNYRPIVIDEFTDCTIWGVVTHIITEAKTV